MADPKSTEEKKAAASAYVGPRLPEPQMVLDSRSYELKQLAREIAEREADPLDEAKRPGGYFLNEAGQPIDANGIAITAADVLPEHKAAKADAKAPQDSGEK